MKTVRALAVLTVGAAFLQVSCSSSIGTPSNPGNSSNAAPASGSAKPAVADPSMELPADATVTLRTPTCVQIQSGDQVDLDRCWDVNEDRYVFTAMGVLSGHEGELGYVVFSTSPGYRLHEVEFRDRPSWNEVASSDYTAVIVYHLSSGRLQRYAFEGGDDVVECDVVGPVPSCRSQMVAP